MDLVLKAVLKGQLFFIFYLFVVITSKKAILFVDYKRKKTIFV
jgi:hypothetical protein